MALTAAMSKKAQQRLRKKLRENESYEEE